MPPRSSRMLSLVSGIALLPWLLPGANGAAIDARGSSAAQSTDTSAAPSTRASSQFGFLPPTSSLVTFTTVLPSASSFTPSTVSVTSSAIDSSDALSSTPLSTSAASSIISLSLPLSTSLAISSASTTAVLSSGSPVSSSGTSAASSSASQPTQSSDPATLANIASVRERRLSVIISGISSVDSVPQLLSTLGDDGKWPATEVDYTTGCDARRANWPAEDHWSRLVTLAAAWHGGVQGASQEFANSSSLLDSIHSAMDFWFANDFKNLACLDSGGTATCPCGTPGLWNTNWYSNVIGVPALLGEACLLVGADAMSETQVNNCTHILVRAYGTFDHGFGYTTGANTLDISKIGIDSGLLINNASMLTDGYARIHREVVVQDAVRADGIRPDGSFGQHGGIIYNGNYGKDYANDVLGLEIAAAGTPYSAEVSNAGSQTAFESLLQGDLWMIYRNVLTDVLHFDFSVLNRFISFPVSDQQATGSININVTEIQELGQLWDSDILQTVSQSLAQVSKDANAGSIIGNRMFYANDYMVQRGPGYVSTLKMYSTRTLNGECTNAENPLGFHLADGTLYTYLQGNEYEDIAAAWDWNLIPGITNDYGATPLSCDHEQFRGKEAFVGGASNGKVGAAAMRYTNPYTGTLKFQKAWFFLDDDVQHVMISSVNSSTDNPVLSVLDQKRLNGPVYVDGVPLSRGKNFSQARTLWHDNVGYTFQQGLFDRDFDLAVDFGARTGDWATIGISSVGNITVDLFSASINHGSGSQLDVPIEYTAFPAVGRSEFERKSLTTWLVTIRNDAHVSAVYDAAHGIASFVFWDAEGGSATFAPSPFEAPITVQTNRNAVVIYNLDKRNATVSDPSQTLSTVQLSFKGGRSHTKTLDVTLPGGGLAGSSVSVQFE